MRVIWGILAVTGVLLAGANARAQTPVTTPISPADPSIEKALETCFKCHGEGGVSRIPSRPTIAGQSADYVASQLHSFRRAALTMKPSIASRSRIDPIMSHMADDLGEGQINALAQVISKLSCDGDALKDTEKVAGLKSLAMPKVGARCVACHGVDGVTSQPGIPNLAGQQRAYLRRELLLIREAAWGATPRENESWRSHPIMESEAARISISDVDALARYYASLDCRGKQRATQ